MKSEIIENILKSDFESQAQIQGFETFSLEAVQKLRDVEKFLMNKSLTEELSEEENIQLDICKGEISTLSVAQVINDNTLKKEHIFYRHNDLEKGGHKYFKREGIPGNYKYYYTEAQYNKEKGEDGKKESNKYSDSINQSPNDPNKKASDRLVQQRKNRVDLVLSRIKEGGGKYETANAEDEVKQFNKYSNVKAEYIAPQTIKLKDSDSPKEESKTYSSDKYDSKNARKTTSSTVYPVGTEIVDVYDKGTNTYRATIPASRFVKESKPAESKESGSKSKEASMVLKEMDNQEEPNYKAALDKVVKETGVDKAKLEKELEKYI